MTTRQRFVVNSIGEGVIYDPRGDMYVTHGLCPGSVSISKLSSRSGHEPTGKNVDARFKRKVGQSLTPKQLRMWREWQRVANAYQPNSLFRHCVEITSRGVCHAWFSVEFCNFLKGAAWGEKLRAVEFWRRVSVFAIRFDARIEVMHESQYLDSWCDQADFVAAEKAGKPIPWVHGPNHGRMERQVSVDVDVLDWSAEKILELRRKMLSWTREAGIDQGLVSVI